MKITKRPKAVSILGNLVNHIWGPWSEGAHVLCEDALIYKRKNAFRVMQELCLSFHSFLLRVNLEPPSLLCFPFISEFCCKKGDEHLYQL